MPLILHLRVQYYQKLAPSRQFLLKEKLFKTEQLPIQGLSLLYFNSCDNIDEGYNLFRGFFLIYFVLRFCVDLHKMDISCDLVHLSCWKAIIYV